MPGLVFDTNIWIAHKPEILPRSLQMSVVVLEELMAGAPDATAIKKYEAAKQYYERENKLLVPTGDDWLMAGRIIYALRRGLKSKHKGKTPKLPDHEKQSILNDVLIARTVRRSGAVLVTDNIKDFAMIQRFCHVRIKSGEEYFG